MRTRYARTVQWVVILLIVGMSGCGLFQTRTIKPGGGPGVPCATPNSPDDVVSNVVQNYARLSGLTCYTSMLDPVFLFHPDGSDSNEAPPGTYLNWTRDVESRVSSTLAADDTFGVAVLDSEYAERVVVDTRTQIRFYNYHLILHASRTQPDTLFRGLSDITFHEGADLRWRITDWVDKRDGSGLRTWGYARGLYRVGF